MTRTMKTGERTTFDVVKGIFACLPKGRFTASAPILHDALWRLAASNEFGKYLRDYVFEERSYFHFCKAFEADLANMELAGLLATPNPDFTTYECRPKLKTTFDMRKASLFSASELDDLGKMATRFSTAIQA